MEKENKLHNIRHSLAHILAMAVLKKDPEAKLGIGPVIDNGFYYDFLLSKPLKDEDLKDVEKTMKKIISQNIEFSSKEISAKDAEEMFANQPFKLELIKELSEEDAKLSVYTSGEFSDLCKGPHVKISKEINTDAFKLKSIAGAYWRGSEDNQMLTRIYGLSFETKDELTEYLNMLIEAEKRDHRKIGKELELFTFDDDVGPGLPLWMPNGTVIVDELEKLAKETETKAGYVRVRTPHIAKESMYLTSGHLPYYKDSMFPPMEYEGGKYYLRAMNCPHHHKIFGARGRSYRELPLRLAEYGTVYRHEKSGELFGLMRVRVLEMNDAHIYCTKEQFESEFKAVNDMYLKYFDLFGIKKYVMRFSTHDPKRLGDKYVNEPALWKETEDMVRKVLVDAKIPFIEIPNEAAFYGPKIDVQVWSAIGREFTLATNQVDFAVPKRFGLTYKDENNEEVTPLCIHRAPLGTHERFIGFLIEHYAGLFPTWLSPIQLSILPISEKQVRYAEVVRDAFLEAGVRVELDGDNESLGKKIRESKKKKIPYMIIIGEKEASSGMITVESRNGSLGEKKIEDFVAEITQEIKDRK
ncbi:MAG: Threonine-tRNA ligase [Parcubacteria group bacterium GW2011_GWF2_38_76]|nr:MAG: Threonine-tRNA ligase [Parcubacteria group bacterium GW2011_GWF2_38_76]HBM45923.1 threonine--tRNA ligase [Patescibacteria group bacterium]